MSNYSAKDYKEELERVKQRSLFHRMVRSTLYGLIVVAAVAVLIAFLVLPVLRIYGTSMSPTLTQGEYVLAIKGDSFKTGDIIAFYYNNKVLVKRVIADSGQWVDIDDDGNVYVNNIAVEEPYISEKALGDCNIKLPYQVPENRIFVMGDRRSISVDSRNSAIGCIADEQIIGRILFKIWPLKDLGPVR